MKTGIFCISIDIELLWGRRDKPNLGYFERRIGNERRVIDKILKLFSKYKIPATWATVGKLYERNNFSYYGLDIIKKIEKVKNQEIGSHSYSHPEFTSLTKLGAQNEFKRFKRKSFVFPRNKIKYLDELKKAGFLVYRGKDQNAYELLIPRIPPTYTPRVDKGLLNIQGSMYFVSGRGFKKLIPSGLRFLKSKLGIDSAVRNKKVFHLWFHPMDFVDDSKKLFEDFEKILIYASKKRHAGQLRILNMDQIQTQFL